ncbi:MAG: DUF2007 domain-containing protein [Anaerolineaceae bacterium]|jgi:arsenate reductase|nr:DUF2007 domain-containing protein [Anaerolineaceae bacterium]MDD4043340.1 DUF2007 domain-containing protein [Anaerolineaceae bacterium]
MNKGNKSDFVTVYKAQGKLDAESIKGFLEAQNIPAYLDINALGQIYGLTVGDLGEVGVMVSKKDETRARELLVAMEGGEFEDEVLVGAPLTLVPSVGDEDVEEDHRRRVLFLCTGNSARSQIAEAVVNHFLAKEWVAFSAGSEPSGFVHPMAAKVIRNFGLEHQGYSKPIDEFLGQEFDMVITMCDSAREVCPLWLKKGPIIHLGFSDPALFDGTDEQKLQVFKDTYEAIKATVISYLEDL